MTYTPEITEINVVDENGGSVVKLNWMDEATIEITCTSILTNSSDWPDLSAAIAASIKTMEESTRQHQAKVNT